MKHPLMLAWLVLCACEATEGPSSTHTTTKTVTNTVTNTIVVVVATIVDIVVNVAVNGQPHPLGLRLGRSPRGR